MGWWDAEQSILHLGLRRGLYRERDVVRGLGLSHGWLELGLSFNFTRRHAWGVWGHPGYEPSRYEIIQTRNERLVFCRESALYLQGCLEREPATIQVSIDDHARKPTTLGPDVEIFRTRHLEAELAFVWDGGGLVPLRVHLPERAWREVGAAVGRRRAQGRTAQGRGGAEPPAAAAALGPTDPTAG